MIDPAAKFARKGQRVKYVVPILVVRMFVKQSVAVNLVKLLVAEKFVILSLEREFVVM
jgi:hypothetical protein